MKKQIPVGATWQFISASGSEGRIWLESRDNHGTEIWKWRWCNSGGSGIKQDWNLTYKAAARECALQFSSTSGKVRFRRVPEFLGGTQMMYIGESGSDKDWGRIVSVINIFPKEITIRFADNDVRTVPISYVRKIPSL